MTNFKWAVVPSSMAEGTLALETAMRETDAALESVRKKISRREPTSSGSRCLFHRCRLICCLTIFTIAGSSRSTRELQEARCRRFTVRQPMSLGSRQIALGGMLLTKAGNLTPRQEPPQAKIQTRCQNRAKVPSY